MRQREAEEEKKGETIQEHEDYDTTIIQYKMKRMEVRSPSS